MCERVAPHVTVCVSGLRVQTTLRERWRGQPLASLLSVSRVLCLYLLSASGRWVWWGTPGGFSLQIYGIADLRIDPPPSPSRGPAVRRRSTNQVGAG